MEIEDEDDFYSPEEPIVTPAKDADASTKQQPTTTTSRNPNDDELEEGEEEDEGGVIIEEDEDDSVSLYSTLAPVQVNCLLILPPGCRLHHRKQRRREAPSSPVSCSHLPHPIPPSGSSVTSFSFLFSAMTRQSRYSDIKNIPQRTASGEIASKPAPVKEEQRPLPVPSADQAAAAASSSKININANPVYPPAGKPITHVNIDTGKHSPTFPS